MDEKSENSSQIKYTVDYRNIKHARLEYKTGHLSLILPKGYETKQNLIEKYKAWIRNKEDFIQQAMAESREKNLELNRTNQQLRNMVNSLIDKHRQKYGFEAKRIFFRKMKSKWGSHSSKGNLTLNTLLKYLPSRLVEYVVFHEMTHYLGKRHNDIFWRAVSKEFGNWKVCEKDLLVYWFIIQDLEKNPQKAGESN